MSWLSSIIGAFTGSSKKKAIRNAASAQTTAANQAIGTIAGANTGANAGINAASIFANDALKTAGAEGAAGLNSALDTATQHEGLATQQAMTRILEAVQQAKDGLSPYTSAGSSAVTGQGDLLGINGPEAQARAIAAIHASPEFQSILSAGNQNILQNASATGGLRGGNTQDTLSRFGGDTLSQLIMQHLAQLGGLAGNGQAASLSLGQMGLDAAARAGQLGVDSANLIGSQGLNVAGLNAADGLNIAGQQGANTMGAAGQTGANLTNTGNNIANLQVGKGGIQAGSIIGTTNANLGAAGNITGLLGNLFSGVSSLGGLEKKIGSFASGLF